MKPEPNKTKGRVIVGSSTVLDHIIVLTNLLSKLLKIGAHHVVRILWPGFGISTFKVMRRLFNYGRARICLLLLVALPVYHQSVKAALPDKWPNSENGSPQWNERSCVKLLCPVSDMLAIIKLRFQLADNSNKSVTPISAPLIPDATETNGGSKTATNDGAQGWACSFGAQMMLFSFGYLMVTFIVLGWQWYGSAWRAMWSNDQKLSHRRTDAW